jgi:3-deoxy-D-manno-octulosonic-acid transferase
VKFIIAPHNIKDEQIQNSKQHQPKNCFILWKENKNLADFDVLSLTPLGFWPKSTVMPILLM